MKKLGLLFATVIMMLMFAFSVSAATEGYYTYEVENGEATITDVSYEISGDVLIPNTLGGYTVVCIGKSAFSYCRRLTGIIIPDGVVSIDNSAFYFCSGLTSIKIPNSVTFIGNSAFRGCTGITNILIPDSVTSIKPSTFLECTGLASITIGNGVTSIGESAFEECSSLKSITIPDSVTSIGTWAFYHCSNLTSITISDSITSIGTQAFYGTSYYEDDSNWENGTLYIGNHLIVVESSTTSLNIGREIKSICSSAFSDCRSLKYISVDEKNENYCSVDGVLFDKNKTILVQYPADNERISFSIPDSVTSIDDYAFYYCTRLTSIIIPDNVTTIGADAFYYCGELSNVVLPDSLESIGRNAFAFCSNLSSIHIPKRVVEIGSGAFWYAGLTKLTFEEDSKLRVIKEDTFVSCRLKRLVLPEGIIKIEKYAFSLAEVTFVVLPSTLNYIGYDAFFECSITDVCYRGTQEQWQEVFKGYTDYMPDDYLAKAKRHYNFNDETIIASGTCGENLSWSLYGSGTLKITGSGDMMDYCDWRTRACFIKKIVFDGAITNIGRSAFYECINLEEITIPNSVTKIGAYAFYNCNSLKSIVVSKDINFIGTEAFSNTSSIEEFIVDENNEHFASKDGVLYSKDKTILVKYPEGKKDNTFLVPEGVTTIGCYSFLGTVYLEEVSFSDTVVLIEEWAFGSCLSLKEINLPNGITEIAYATFIDCEALEKILIPDSVKSIESSAFRRCKSLVEISFLESINIDSDVFVDCSSLVEFNFPQTTTIIPYGFFEGCKSLSSVTIPYSIKEIDQSVFSSCRKLTDIYYGGNEEEWDLIKIGKYNGNLSGGTVNIHYCYHNETIFLPSLQPTCTTIGLTEGEKCNDCGRIVAEQTEISMLAHTYNLQNTKQPNHKEPGIKTFACACGDTYTEVIAVIPHSYDEFVIAPTCTERGYIIYTCECGETYTDFIDKFPHEYTEVIAEATCENGGYTTYICDCGEFYTADKTSATGHSYNSDNICTVCGESKMENCTCNCHKGGISGFIWKILRIFYKLFGTNKTCPCGISHY